MLDPELVAPPREVLVGVELADDVGPDVRVGLEDAEKVASRFGWKPSQRSLEVPYQGAWPVTSSTAAHTRASVFDTSRFTWS